MNEWLNELEIGDKVIVISTRYHGNDKVAAVTRTTKTQVVVEGHGKFTKKNGSEFGKYGSHVIVEATQERAAKIEEKKLRGKLTDKIDACDLARLSTEQLQQITSIIGNSNG